VDHLNSMAPQVAAEAARPVEGGARNQRAHAQFEHRHAGALEFAGAESSVAKAGYVGAEVGAVEPQSGYRQLPLAASQV
jgi:hypothetical protein